MKSNPMTPKSKLNYEKMAAIGVNTELIPLMIPPDVETRSMKL